MGAEATGSEAQYAFDDVRVDPRSHRVFKAGQELTLEPKAYGVLLELLRRAGDVVERDRLLDAVWGHRHVTPAVLNRIIALLRKALGDDAEHPRLIRTVHGVGYAFIATIEAASEARTAEPEQFDAYVTGPTPAVGPAVPPGRRSTAMAAGVFVAIAGAAVAAWMLRTSDVPVTTSAVPVTAPSGGDVAAAGPSTVAVLPLVLRGAIDADRAVAAGLGDSLDEMLSRLSDVRVTARESARIAHERTTDARAAGELLGVAYVLHGSVEPQAGETISVELELLRTRDGLPVWASAFQQPRDQLFRILGPTLDGVQRILRPTAPAASDPLVEADESAQDLYWSARRLFATPSPGGVDRAVGLLERAVEQDPKFALAYCSLSSGYRFQSMGGRRGVDEAAAKAQAAVARALEINPRLMCAHLEAAFILTTQWRAAQAAPAVRRALELAPGDAAALELAGNVAAYTGRPRDALELHRRAAAADPLNAVRSMTAWYDLTLLGRPEEALAVLDRAAGATPLASVLVIGLRARISLAFGRIAEALDVYRRSDVANQRRGLYDRLNVALAYSHLGLHADAEAELRNVVPSRANPPLYIDVRMTAFWAAGRFADAVAWIEGEGALSVQEPWLSTWRAQARALAGEADSALADYDAALAGDIDRRTLAYSWFSGRFGVGQLANWAVLRESHGRDATGPATAFRALVQEMADGGTATPAMDYYRAVDVALAGDAEAASRHLGRAFAAGWRDATAFDTDLVWRRYADAPWLQRHRTAMREALAAERAKVEAAR